jgi:hypothetical protein
MKFIGVNALRINRETVQQTLINAFSDALLYADLSVVKMRYHKNGDIGLIFQPSKKQPPKQTMQETIGNAILSGPSMHSTNRS